MELTIKQALQQGASAHQEGKLEDAERLYRAILQSQPTHPDANHNLGLIAVSVNKVDAALPLFKTALEANPKIEQFWLSYFDALIKEKQVDNAKVVLEQAKKQDVAGEKLNVLEAQLASINKEENVDSLSPSQQELSSLLEHYQNGRYGDTESLALSLTQEFPKHQFGWKVLGAVLKQTGRVRESLVPNQKAAALSPQDAEAHSNLGVTLQELGRLDEAEVSYKKAIALKPDYAEAHSNLANALKELKRLDEAEASYTQAIVLKPDYVASHYNLAVTLQGLGRLDEAEASYRKAVALKPDYADAHYNLGVIFQTQGRLENAISSFTQASFIDPKNPTFYAKRGLTPSLIARQPLINRESLMKSINDGDWESSEMLLKQVFDENPQFINEHVEEFIKHWCGFCRDLVNQVAIKKSIPIFIKLFVMVEQNKDVNKLIQIFFKHFDIDIVLELAESKDRMLIKVAYCQYIFVKEDFLQAEALAIESIQNAASIIKVTTTEDIGWLIVRRSLKSCPRKDVSRRALTHLIDNLEN